VNSVIPNFQRIQINKHLQLRPSFKSTRDQDILNYLKWVVLTRFMMIEGLESCFWIKLMHTLLKIIYYISISEICSGKSSEKIKKQKIASLSFLLKWYSVFRLRK